MKVMCNKLTVSGESNTTMEERPLKKRVQAKIGRGGAKLLAAALVAVIFGLNAAAQDAGSKRKAKDSKQSEQQMNKPLNRSAFMKLPDAKALEYLQAKEPKMAELFLDGVKLKRTGKWLLIPGLVVTGAGIATMAVGFGKSDFDESEISPALYAGMGITGVGLSVSIASVPFTAMGIAKKKQAKKQYGRKHLLVQNDSCEPSLDLIASRHGIGIALKF